MTSLTPYLFGEKSVRVILDGKNEPWFVAKDVALALGYQWNGSSRVSHVPEDWKGVTSVVTPYGTQEMLTLSEQGLYFFLKSCPPSARRAVMPCPGQRLLQGGISWMTCRMTSWLCL